MTSAVLQNIRGSNWCYFKILPDVQMSKYCRKLSHVKVEGGHRREVEGGNIATRQRKKRVRDRPLGRLTNRREKREGDRGEKACEIAERAERGGGAERGGRG